MTSTSVLCTAGMILFGAVVGGCAETASPPAPAKPTAKASGVPGAPPAPGAASSAPVEPEMVREVASEDVTLKGQKSEPIGEGLISTPARAFLRIPDKIVFDSITHALNLYEAANGHAPKDHDEFMKGVIEANQIQLPELPPDSRYVYDPESKELLVEHPR